VAGTAASGGNSRQGERGQYLHEQLVRVRRRDRLDHDGHRLAGNGVIPVVMCIGCGVQVMVST
jgi:hypothetical protein